MSYEDNAKLNKMMIDIFNKLPEQIFLMNKNGEIIFCNKTQYEVFGFSCLDDLLGKTIFQVGAKLNWDISIAQTIRNNDLRVMESKISLTVEEEIIINNEHKYFLTTKTPVFDEQGNVDGISGISIDITERKRAEKLAVEHKILEEKFKVSQNLAGVMAHELRTPIATFKLYADLIKSVIQNPEMSFEDKQNNIVELVEKCYEVEKSSTQFIDMILYRLRSTNNKLDPARFDLCLIADDIEDVLDTYAFGSGERALITVKKANAFTYKGDSVATKHIASNLIKNTLKIIKEEDKGKITISFDQSDPMYNKMIFEDDAKGIDEKFLPLIFDSFVYKDSTGKGTGLGLAFCKMIMVDYGGDIICESELGKYTRFTCLFPKVDMSEFDFA